MEKEIKHFSSPSNILSTKTFANDDRFIHVKLAVCSHEQVANGIRFNRESLENKMSQLDFLPIVGLIKVAELEDGTCKYVLGSHETELEVVDGNLQYTSKTVVFGTVMPNTAKFEMITRHGETKEYVTVEALLYANKYPQLNSVINLDTDASMEIDGVDYEWNEDDVCFDVSDFRYTAHCLINVPPAFKLAGVTNVFSMDDFKQEYSTLLEEVRNFSLNILENKEEEKGGDCEMEDDKKLEVDSVVEQEEEVETDELYNEQTDATEELAKKRKCEKEDFELSHDDIRNLLSYELDDVDEDGYRKYNVWVMEVFDTYCVYQKYGEQNQYFKASYTKSDENVTIGDVSEVFMMYLTQEEKDKIESDKSAFKELTSKFEEVNGKYQEYVAKEELSAKTDMINSFSKSLTQDEISKCIDDINKFTVSEIETMLTLEVGKRARIEKDVKFTEEKSDTDKSFVNFSSYDNNSYFAQLARKIKK